MHTKYGMWSNNLHKYDHISENMMTLHWLKIHERIMFKTTLLVYKCRCGLAPKYLQELLPRPSKTWTLLSSYTTVMVPEFFKNEQAKSASFSAVGTCIWSTLPLQVKKKVPQSPSRPFYKHTSSSLTTSLKDQTTQMDMYKPIILLTDFYPTFTFSHVSLHFRNGIARLKCYINLFIYLFIHVSMVFQKNRPVAFFYVFQRQI